MTINLAFPRVVVRGLLAIVLFAVPARAEDSESAAEHAKLAQAAYDVQEYKTAIEQYRAAYQLDQKPEYMWALAQAQRLSGDCRSAIKSYQAFRRRDVTPNQSTAAELMITRCEAQIEKQEAEAARERAKADEKRTSAPVRTSAESGAVSEPAERDAPAASSGLSPAWFVVGAVISVGLGAASVWSGVDVLTKNDAYESNPTRERYEDGADREQRTNILLLATGAAVTVTAAVGIFFTDWSGGGTRSGRRRPASRAQVGVVPHSGGGAVTVGGRF